MVLGAANLWPYVAAVGYPTVVLYGLVLTTPPKWWCPPYGRWWCTVPAGLWWIVDGRVIVVGGRTMVVGGWCLAGSVMWRLLSTGCGCTGCG